VRIVDDGEVHADEFWATALACRGASNPYQPYDYRGARRGRTGDRDADQRMPRAGRARFGDRRGVL